MSRQAKKGFTLIELLVVIAIIAMLLSIMAPSLHEARERGKRAVCLANLRAIGHAIHVYALDNNDRLVPGDSRVSWEVWGPVTEGPDCAPAGASAYRHVNLGHLMVTDEIIPLPSGSEHVFFCPSGRSPSGSNIRQEFDTRWGRTGSHAATSYMFNNALDGFDAYVQDGDTAVLSHKNVVQYLLVDGSAHAYKDQPLVYDDAIGPEHLQEVALRHGVCFPTLLLHEWLAEGRVNMQEARTFLADATAWATANQKPAAAVCLADIRNTALVSDVVGVWGGAMPNPPSG
ncbi:MAG: type II secretion system protein [Phycisphaerae bacterium]|nr:type II secretion system protein [Phycisphaerae bacterium]